MSRAITRIHDGDLAEGGIGWAGVSLARPVFRGRGASGERLFEGREGGGECGNPRKVRGGFNKEKDLNFYNAENKIAQERPREMWKKDLLGRAGVPLRHEGRKRRC